MVNIYVYIYTYIWGFPEMGGTPKWMVYKGKSSWNGWFGGTPISGFNNGNGIWQYGFYVFIDGQLMNRYYGIVIWVIMVYMLNSGFSYFLWWILTVVEHNVNWGMNKCS